MLTPKPKSVLPTPDQKDDIERLEKEVAHLKEVQEKILKQKKDLELKVQDMTVEIGDLKKSNATSYERLREIEATKETLAQSDSAKEGYVTLATMNMNGKYPERSRIKMADGKFIIIPREVKDGVAYEDIPVKMALAFLTEGSGWKRYITGPTTCDKIEGDVPVMQAVPHGIYPKHFVFHRHVVEKGTNGIFFKKVEVVESKETLD